MLPPELFFVGLIFIKTLIISMCILQFKRGTAGMVNKSIFVAAGANFSYGLDENVIWAAFRADGGFQLAAFFSPDNNHFFCSECGFVMEVRHRGVCLNSKITVTIQEASTLRAVSPTEVAMYFTECPPAKLSVVPKFSGVPG